MAISAEELVNSALDRLQNMSIKPIEWRAVLYQRMGVPISIRDYAFLIPDDDMDKACKELADLGLLSAPDFKLLNKTEGDFELKASFFELNEPATLGQTQRLALYPSSFCSFFDNELTTEQRQYTVSRESTILVPKQSAVYASMIRMMATYPEYCVERTILCSDLSELINHHLYGLDEDTLDTEEEDFDEKYEMGRRLSDADSVVRTWTGGNEWRTEEEWIGDVMDALVRGCAIYEALPW